MKRTIICGIPMKERLDKVVYTSEDISIPVSDKPVCYPINAYIGSVLRKEDDIKVILLVKEDVYGHYKNHMELFKTEFAQATETVEASVRFVTVNTEFAENKSVHEQLMGNIVNELEEDSHIMVDATYGPKDLPIILFVALNFAEKFLRCQIDNIIYGQASFVDGKAVDTKLCDMIPLYYLASVTNSIQSSDAAKARAMLKSLLSL